MLTTFYNIIKFQIFYYTIKSIYNNLRKDDALDLLIPKKNWEILKL